MPMEPIIVPLADPIEGHDGKITSITVRPADYRTIMRLGEPFEFIAAKGGGQYALEHPDTISAYLEAMVDKPVVPLLPQVGMRDTLALKKAVMDFFTTARTQPQKAK